MKYPVPSLFRWTLLLEFPNGDVLMGESAEDLVDKWGARLGWLQDEPLTRVQTKLAVVRYLRVFYGTEINVDVHSTDQAFIEAVGTSGIVTLYRK